MKAKTITVTLRLPQSMVDGLKSQAWIKGTADAPTVYTDLIREAIYEKYPHLRDVERRVQVGPIATLPEGELR